MNGLEEIVFIPPDKEIYSKYLDRDYFDEKEFPHSHRGHNYAIDIIRLDIISCIYIKFACARYIKDLKRIEDSECTFYFDPKKSEKFLRLGQKFKHVKGRWKTDHIEFEPWQLFKGLNIFGFIDKRTESRRFRSAHIEVARGNGKSADASIMGLYFLCLEDPIGNEVYSAATKKDQARIILDSSRAMAKANKSFLAKTGTNVLKHHIEHEESNSFFKALSSDSDSLDGLQPALGLIDELHAHKTRDVFDVLDSAMSKRSDSLMYVITTAGTNTDGIGYSESQYAKKLLLGEVENDQYFALVYTLDENDEPYDSSVWIKSNPNLGVSVDEINLKSKANKAKDDPASENNFFVKHLNLWTNSYIPFFNLKKWEICKNLGVVNLEDMKGESCFVGIDLSSKIDITSFSYVFHPGDEYYFFNKFFLPEERLNDSRNKDLYRKWSKQNWLNLTPGNTLNFGKLQDELLEDSKHYSMQEVYYDPWNAEEFAQNMLQESIEMVEFRMNTGNLSEPMKRFGAIILDLHARHEGNPMFAWMLRNVVAKYDANENVFPRKEHQDLKIDGSVSSIMALAGHLRKRVEISVYETRGVVVI